MARIIKRPPPSGPQRLRCVSCRGEPPPLLGLPPPHACRPPARRPENPTLCPSTLRPHRPARPRASPSAPVRESEAFAAAGRDKSGDGGHLRARAGSPGSPGSSPLRPVGWEQRRWVAERREPRPRAGEGRRGGGARRCAPRSRLSTWQLQFAGPSLTLRLPGARCGAEPRPPRGRGPPTRSLRVPCPCTGRVAGSSRTPLRELWYPGGRTPPSSFWSWWAGPRGGGSPECGPAFSTRPRRPLLL